MREWQIAVEKFLKDYQNDPYYEGAILTGSYASRTNNNQSDIDLIVIIADKQKWYEDGAVMVDGFIIKYTIKPIEVYKKDFQDEFENGSLMSATMFVKGKVISDKKGTANQLRDLAFTYAEKKFDPMTDDEAKKEKYELWNLYNEMKSAYIERRVNFGLLYYKLIEELTSFNRDFHQKQVLPIHKLDKLAFEEDYRDKYGLRDPLGATLIKELKSVFSAKEDHEKNTAMDGFYKYIMDNTGGFEIGEYKIRKEL